MTLLNDSFKQVFQTNLLNKSLCYSDSNFCPPGGKIGERQARSRELKVEARKCVTELYNTKKHLDVSVGRLREVELSDELARLNDDYNKLLDASNECINGQR